MKKTVRNFLDLLINERGLSENTVEAYRNDLSQYADYLFKIKECADWSAVTEVYVMNYLYHLKDSGLAPTTIARKVAAIRGLHRYLFLNHQTDTDPAYTLDLPKIERNNLPVLLTTEQIGRLLTSPDPQTKTGRRDRALLELLYATGMRVSELIHLDVAHVSLELGFVHCIGKKGSERVLPLHSEAVQALHGYLSDRGQPIGSLKNQPLFVNRANKRLSRQGIWKILKRSAQSASITLSISPETIRQSLTAHLLQNGAPLEFVDELMGRTQLAVSTRYAHLRHAPIKEVYAKYHPWVKDKTR